MKRLLSVLLLAAGCSSGPDEEELALGLFNRLALDFNRYNASLESGDLLEQSRVAYEIRQLTQRHFDRLVQGLESGELEQQSYAVFALGFSKDPAAIAPLVEATASPEVGLRANAVASLGMLGLAEVPIKPFRERLEDDFPDVRLAALYGLRQLLPRGEDLGLLEKIHEKLSDPSEDVRNEAIILLRKIRKPESIDAIIGGSIADEEILVRSNAAVTLGSYGPEARRANPYLIEMLLDPNPKAVESAWAALNEINEKDLDRSYASWRDWYDDEQRHFYSCPAHREVEEKLPGDCGVCKAPLERFAKDTYKKGAPLVVVVFSCPDHPQVVTSTPSTCGKEGCGKRLVQRKADSVVYVCPDHKEVETSTPAKCGKTGCGKDLVPKK